MKLYVFVDCLASYTLINGFVNFTGKVTTYEAQVAATCNEGYEIEGDPKITCQADGMWSDNTACRAIPAEGNVYILSTSI